MNERQLLDILVGFATTLTAEFSIQDVLGHLVDQVVDLLPVTGAGVLLMDGAVDHHVISATDELRGGQTLADVVASYLLIARQRDQAIASAEVLSDAALHDHLTGLPDRRLLRDRLEQATDRSRRSDVPGQAQRGGRFANAASTFTPEPAAPGAHRVRPPTNFPALVTAPARV